MSATAPISFTSRDLNRQPARVLEAARKFGSIEVRTRSGEIFKLSLADSTAKPTECPDFKGRWQRLRELGCLPAAKRNNERINRVIAGEP